MYESLWNVWQFQDVKKGWFTELWREPVCLSVCLQPVYIHVHGHPLRKIKFFQPFCSWDTQTAMWRGSQTFFFCAEGIIIIVSRTPFKLMPGELFSIDLFTAIIKCLWIVQQPIFKSLFILFEGSGKSIKLEKLSYFSSGEEKQSRELLTLKCCCRFKMNEKLVWIVMSWERDF